MGIHDLIIFIGNLLFSIAIMPSVTSVQKPHWKTSLLTSIILTIFTLNFAAMGLWLSVLSTFVSAVLWWILLFQSIKSVINDFFDEFSGMLG